MTQFEREEDQLIDDYNAGRISEKEFRAEMRELRNAARAAAEEAAEEAYFNELERW